MTSLPHNETIMALIESAKHNVKETEQLAPVFFIGDSEQCGVYMPDFSSDSAKSKAAQDVRELVKSVKADWVFFIAESWGAKCKDDAEWEEMCKKYGRSISKWPTAKEIVMFKLETPSGTWGGTADILPGRELGEITWHHNQEEKGRFTGFFERETVH